MKKGDADGVQHFCQKPMRKKLKKLKDQQEEVFDLNP